MPGKPVITTISNPKTIWALLHAGDAKTVLVQSTGVTADTNGRKIVPAGSILGSAKAGETIFANNAPAKIVNDGTAEGVLVNDVDVTHGDVEGAMAFTGAINLNKMPVKPMSAASTAMRRITFMDI